MGKQKRTMFNVQPQSTKNNLLNKTASTLGGKATVSEERQNLSRRLISNTNMNQGLLVVIELSPAAKLPPRRI